LIQKELKIISKISSFTGLIFVFGYVITTIGSIIIARIVGPQILGTIAIALSVLQILVFFTHFGINRSLLKFIPHYLSHNNQFAVYKLCKDVIIFSLLASVILIILYYLGINHFLFIFYKDINKFPFVLDTFILLLPILSMIGVFKGILNGFQMPHHIRLGETIIYPIIRLVSFLVIIYFLNIFTSLIISTIFAFICSLFYFGWFINKTNKNLSINKDPNVEYSFKTFLIFSLPLFFISLFDLAAHQMDMLLIGHYLNAKLSGIYFISRKFATLVIIPLSLFSPLIGASIAKLYARKNKYDILNLYQYSTKWILILSGVLFSVLFIEANNFLEIAGDKYIEGVTALRIIASAQLVNAFVGPTGNTLIIMNRGKILLFNNLVSIFSGLAFALYLIPNYYLTGAAISICIIFSLVNVLSAIYLILVLKIYPMKITEMIIRIICIISTLIIDIIILNALKVENCILSIIFIFILNLFILPTSILIVEGFSEQDRYILHLIRKKINSFFY
jgi:O-antigen/teichoic acid export membrane protein